MTKSIHNQRKWSTYIMVGNIKIYKRRSMTTLEAIKWLQDNCTIQNTDYYMRGRQVFCECK